MSAVVGFPDLALNPAVAGVHQGARREMQLAVGVGAESLAEMTLRQTVTGFVQDNGLDVKRIGRRDTPREVVRVVDLAERDVESSIVVDVGRVAVGVGE